MLLTKLSGCIGAADQAFTGGVRPRRFKPWLSPRFFQAHAEFAAQGSKLRTGRATRSMRAKYRQLRRRMERIKRDDWRRWVDSRCDAAKTAADAGNSRELYSIVRQLGGKSRDAPVYPVKDSNGKRATTPEDVAKVHAEYLYSKFSLGDFDSTGVDAAPGECVADNLVITYPPTMWGGSNYC